MVSANGVVAEVTVALRRNLIWLFDEWMDV